MHFLTKLGIAGRHVNIPDVQVAFRPQQPKYSHSSLNKLNPLPASKVAEKGVFGKDGNAPFSFLRVLSGINRSSGSVSVV